MSEVTFDTIPISSIKVLERARKEYGDIESLGESIKSRGLIQPLAVKRLDNDPEYSYLLLAGERRLMALNAQGITSVPVRIYPSDLSTLESKSIELAENFHRKNFEYYEYDKLTAEINELQQQIKGKKASGPGDHGWSMEDTSNLLGVSKASVHAAIKRHEAREAFPELFDKCKTQNDAAKVVKHMSEVAIKDAISKKLQTSHANTALDKLAKSYILQDFLEGVKSIPDGVYHLVEIDPPYAIELGKAKMYTNNTSPDAVEYNEISADAYPQFMLSVLKECYRVMIPNSWLILWFAPDPWFESMHQLLTSTGFTTNRLCGIWTKPNGQSKHPEDHLANGYEMFYWAKKGHPALNKPGRLNVFTTPPIPASKKVHPTERPIELMTDIYDTFAFPGSRVLIPFAGSGNGIIAASRLGMTPLAFDLSKAYRDSFLVKLYSACRGKGE